MAAASVRYPQPKHQPSCRTGALLQQHLQQLLQLQLLRRTVNLLQLLLHLRPGQQQQQQGLQLLPASLPAV
jgi:hypothetical protein